VEYGAHSGEKINGHKILVRTPEEKEPLGRPKCTWGINIKFISKE
jgi:hypothetical protein